MRSSRTSLGATAALAMGLAAGSSIVPAPSTTPTASERGQQTSPAKSTQDKPTAAKAARLDYRPLYRRLAPTRRGKAYRASVRQHQRHATKACNQRRHRAAGR